MLSLRDPGLYVHKPDVQNKWEDNINVNVQYNGGLLPDIILLTQCYSLHWGESVGGILIEKKLQDDDSFW